MSSGAAIGIRKRRWIPELGLFRVSGHKQVNPRASMESATYLFHNALSADTVLYTRGGKMGQIEILWESLRLRLYVRKMR
jgi:hypothetical protein